jgi:UrcA family protein
MKLRPLILAAAAFGTMAATPALAESIAVEYGDLDLATEHGQQVLERRIDIAARQTCGLDAVKTGRVSPSTAARKCYKAARAELDRKFAMVVEQASNGG